MPLGNLAIAGSRREERDLVYHATSLTTPDGRRHPAVVVNISPGGFMARCDPMPAVGTRLRLVLPQVDAILAEVRWALGGRIGCEFARPIPPASYYAVLGQLHA